LKQQILVMIASALSSLVFGQNVGIGTQNPTSKLHVNGSGKFDSSTLEIGAAIAGKDADAGKFKYLENNSNLEIFGAGTNANNRKISFYTEGGSSFNGALTSPNITLFGDNPTPFTAFSSQLESQSTEDQVNTTANSAAGFSVANWQSFTAGVTGKLDYVSMYYSNSSTINTTLKIYKGEGTTGQELVSVVFDILGNVVGGFKSSPALNVDIKEGEKYTIWVGNSATWFFNSFSVYSGGVASFNSNADYRFKTFVFAKKRILQLTNGQVNAINGAVILKENTTANTLVTTSDTVTVKKLQVGNTGTAISKIQNGSKAVGSLTGSFSTKIVTVAFPTAFASVPRIVATVQNELSSQNDEFMVTIKGVTTTEATFIVRRIDATGVGWGQNPQLNWWASE
jgi:hypothetical protein